MNGDGEVVNRLYLEKYINEDEFPYYWSLKSNEKAINIDGIIHNPAYRESFKLSNFSVYKQLYSWSCAPTTISIVYTYLIEPKNENQILNENKLINRN